MSAPLRPGADRSEIASADGDPPDLTSVDAETFPTATDGFSAASAGPSEVGDEGEGEDATLVDAAGHRTQMVLDASLGALDGGTFDDRYELGEALGRGGMGDVRLARDRRVGRSVALKLIRAEGAKRSRLRARFLFEARMQGQLEHPSIVPVYDLGVRPDGSEYFTMRRVRGRNLHEVLRGLRLGDAAISSSFSRRRLLAAFQSVCLAVEFAHQRGVVHRDLKPANIMLGEFGEVILLDWGLAKLRDPKASQALDRAALVPWTRETRETRDTRETTSRRTIDMTAVGEVLGSPGYMSPEQAIDSQSVGTAADVFALGAILFEILTLQRMVEGENNARISSNTRLGEYDAHITKRFPELEVPPELEAVCVRATEFEPRARYARARDLADAVASYLEGDRDVARRRSMASRHARAAISALTESVRAASADVAKASRSRAIREVNHALAIDPSSQVALHTMMRILREAPAALAPEAEAALRASEARGLRLVARRGVAAYLTLAATIGLMGLLGVVDPIALGSAVGFFLAAGLVTAAALARAPALEDPASAGTLEEQADALDVKAFGKPSLLPAVSLDGVIVTVILLSSGGIAASSLLFGPLVYVPSLAGANVVVFAAGVARRHRLLALVLGLAAVLVPLGLELGGVIAPGWTYVNDRILIAPRAVNLPGPNAALLLALASVSAILFPFLLVSAERDARLRAERELVERELALAEFVPAEAGEAIAARNTISP